MQSFADYLKSNLDDDQLSLFNLDSQPKAKPKTQEKTQKKAPTPPTKTSVPKATQTKKYEPPKPKAKIVEFPTKERPKVEKAKTIGNATYEDCVAKLEAERKEFKDADSQYVIDGLLELCKVDADFRNNLMRKDKTYKGSFEYFSDMARNGYAIKYGSMSYLDNDIALSMAIDYFNKKE